MDRNDQIVREFNQAQDARAARDARMARNDQIVRDFNQAQDDRAARDARMARNEMDVDLSFGDTAAARYSFSLKKPCRKAHKSPTKKVVRKAKKSPKKSVRKTKKSPKKVRK